MDILASIESKVAELVAIRDTYAEDPNVSEALDQKMRRVVESLSQTYFTRLNMFNQLVEDIDEDTLQAERQYHQDYALYLQTQIASIPDPHTLFLELTTNLNRLIAISIVVLAFLAKQP